MKNDNHPAPLDRIVYISIPEESEQEINGFQIDSSVLMPVEIPPGENEWRMQDLSWEMIIAAMLKIFAWQPDHKDIEYYRDFIKAVQPGINAAMSETGIVKAQNRDFEIAEEIFRALANFAPDIAQNLTYLALIFEEQQELYEGMQNHEMAEYKTDSAFETYKTGLELHPESEDLLYNGGNFFLKHGNFEKAAELLERFTKVSSDEDKKGQISGILDKIKNINSDDILFSEAYELITMGSEENGIKKVKKYLEGNPDVWNAWFLLGWAFRRLEDYTEARTALEKCLELNENNIDTYNELAICLMELGELPESRRMLNKALRIDGDNIKIISNMGILSLKEQNTEEAAGFFRTVLELEPEDEIARKYLEFLSEKK